jgi:hypothetical protein
MQSINQPQAALLAGMQQGGNLSQYQQGQLAFADGGLASLGRDMYAGGGTAIGGGIIQGTPMSGGRTGYWKPFKKIFEKGKKTIKKLVPKELAGIMQMAAPFVAPHSMLGAAALSGLGQYKSRGKISPFQLAMSVAPGITRGNISSMTGGKFGVRGSNENFIRNLMGRSNIGSSVDKYLFGEGPKVGRLDNAWGQTIKQPFEAAIPGKEGLLGFGGEYGGLGEVLKKGGEAILMKGKPGERELDKMALISIGLGGASYVEAKKQMALMGEGDLEDDYGITEEIWEATDWDQAFKDNATLGGNAEGGIPRTRYAMGTSQFPMTSTRQGLAWGSDKGEGLGGQEVEADMRYEGGFMPYGEKPKADDVPARLSKNEFVFTDEAVAGMGDGDVNQGAERLYNMMKQLEEQGAQGQMGIGAMV